jgi:prepilin-type N-terminal cleavage/methylation domain-containing protein
MTKRLLSSPSGFTIVEMMIALSIFFLVVGGLFQIFGPSNVMYAAGHRKLDNQQSARIAMDTIVRQMRMAGYFPENFDADPGNDVVGNVTVQIATDTALAILGDTDGTGASRVLMFCLSGDEVRMLRETLAVATYQCGNGQAIAENITTLRFAYFDLNNMPIPAVPAVPYALDGQMEGVAPNFGNTAERGAVRTVVITVTAQQNVPGQPAQVYTLSSNVRFRNLN